MFFFVIVWRAFSVCFKALFSALTRILVWKTKLGKKNKRINSWTLFFVFHLQPPSRAAIIVCWIWAPGATTICGTGSSSPPLNVSLQQGLFWYTQRKICLWDGPFVWKMSPHAKTDTDSCLLCHSKRQFLCLSLSLLSLRVLTLNKCNTTVFLKLLSFYIITTFFI